MIITGTDKKEYQIDLKRHSGEESAPCPACAIDRKKKNLKPFSWNHDKKQGHCQHCQLSFYDKANTAIVSNEKKEYILPVKNLTKVSDKVLKWFKSRGISQATVMSFDITESIEYMPQIGKNSNCLNFNYFRNGSLVNIKYRDGAKNFKLVSGAELIFYNYDKAKDSKIVVICEGEMDCMSLHEAGVFAVVSVPDGAKTSDNAKLEYLNNCYDILEDKICIVLAVDNDEAGVKFRDILADRLGRDRCRTVVYPDGCKDANDVLVNHGPDVLKKVIEDGQPFPLEGIDLVCDIRHYVDEIYKNGYPKVEGIGFNGLDSKIRFSTGQLTVVTGIPGSGKSEFMDQIMVKLSEVHGWRHGVFSAENQPVQLHIAKLMEKKAGEYITGFCKMSVKTYEETLQFINEHFFFIKIIDENLKVENILNRAKELITRYGIKFLIIDNWANLEHNYSGETEHQYIGKSLIKLFNFCKAYNIHIVVVAHPTKIKKRQDGSYEVATLYDISGSSHWFNKVDNGISIYRDYQNNITTAHIMKVRHRYNGEVGSQDFQWSPIGGRYLEI